MMMTADPGLGIDRSRIRIWEKVGPGSEYQDLKSLKELESNFSFDIYRLNYFSIIDFFLEEKVSSEYCEVGF